MLSSHLLPPGGYGNVSFSNAKFNLINVYQIDYREKENNTFLIILSNSYGLEGTVTYNGNKATLTYSWDFTFGEFPEKDEKGKTFYITLEKQ